MCYRQEKRIADSWVDHKALRELNRNCSCFGGLALASGRRNDTTGHDAVCSLLAIKPSGFLPPSLCKLLSSDLLHCPCVQEPASCCICVAIAAPSRVLIMNKWISFVSLHAMKLTILWRGMWANRSGKSFFVFEKHNFWITSHR